MDHKQIPKRLLNRIETKVFDYGDKRKFVAIDKKTGYRVFTWRIKRKYYEELTDNNILMNLVIDCCIKNNIAI